MNKIKWLFAVGVVLWGTSPLVASQLVPQSLEEIAKEGILTKDTIVFEAKVEKVDLKRGKQVTSITYDVIDVSLLQGEMPDTPKQAAYMQIVPVKYDENGEVIMSFSPILPCSAHEFAVKEGEIYLFFSNMSVHENKQIHVFRVEPIDRKEAVLEILKTLPDEVGVGSMKEEITISPGELPTGFCGSSTGKACTTDEDCTRSGCNGEVCAGKDESVPTSCVRKPCHAWRKYNLRCGCVNGRCRWRN